MTRFARAIGSKASNARLKSDPTPWSEMAPPKTNAKRNAESIEDDEVTAARVDEPQTPPKKVAKIVKLGNTKVTPKVASKSKPIKKEKIVSEKSEAPSIKEVTKPAVAVTSNESESNSEEPKKKTKKKKVTPTVNNGDSSDMKENIEAKPLSVETPTVVSSDATGSKSEKPKKAKKKQKKLASSSGDNSTVNESAQAQAEDVKPSSENNSEAKNETDVGEESKGKEAKKKTGKKKNSKKLGKTNPANTKLSQNNAKSGQKKAQGQGQSETNASEHAAEDNCNEDNNRGGYNSMNNAWGTALKKKKVQCLRCRRMGHKANECKQERKGKLCYKCGDTQHTSRECAIQEEVYKFAECFICRQTGHLTKSCPNNTKGIYPHGGSCFKCGENTHLAKNCPTLKQVEEEKDDSKETRRQEVFVGILDAKQSGDADVSEAVSETPRNKKGKKQVVKF